MTHTVVNGQLQVEGAKCGRERELPVNSEARIAAVARVESTAKALGNANGRIMPTELSLKQAYNTQRLAEGASRKQVAEELGHGREEVVAHYAP